MTCLSTAFNLATLSIRSSHRFSRLAAAAMWRPSVPSGLLLTLSVVPHVLAQGDIGGSQASCSSAADEWKMVGCYNTGNSGRHVNFNWMLQSSSSDVKYYPGFTGSGNMTVEICQTACRGHGFQYCALFYGIECYCSPTFPALNAPSTNNASSGPGQPTGSNPTLQVAQSNCQSTCSGNSSEYCGGGDAAEVYMDPSFPTSTSVDAPTNYKYLGCYSNINPGPMYTTIATPDTYTCVQYCGELGYPYAQRSGNNANQGSTCGCGTEIQAGYQIDESNCNQNCNGTIGSSAVPFCMLNPGHC